METMNCENKLSLEGTTAHPAANIMNFGFQVIGVGISNVTTGDTRLLGGCFKLILLTSCWPSPD